ncbi:siphovirus Gp157 family protein [Phyllobacterium sp. BT25]|uniref:Siphovirus Gp157 family protein n=1 Tax=Phyllobacterium pellucidum TaxID=2740464 RepID=A0A849VKG9_9HYPH|nr:siphovirus Gp157 family protein [Phyllobacterium pellucidum]NTS30705.1 siphovirus Gp157 family protein [Phyllobacterium pellucidum]
MSDASHSVHRQAEAAKRLLASLRESGDADDQDIVETAIEGETSLLEAIAAAMDANDEDDILIVGIKAKEETLAERRRAAEQRIERRRAAMEQAMIVTDQEKFTLPTATIFLTKRKPNIVVDNEADIPAAYWTIPKVEPKLDKKALKEALEAKEEIPGAHLDNGSVSISIRRK